MTNQEAKKKLYMEWQKFLEDNIDYAGISDAYKTAFKALDQEPCEDAISRQAVLDCFTATKLKKFDFILHAREEIKKLPPVTPQPKMGKWIKRPNGFKCSKCLINHKSHSIYCPSCGARMVEPQERSGEE